MVERGPTHVLLGVGQKLQTRDRWFVRSNYLRGIVQNLLINVLRDYTYFTVTGGDRKVRNENSRDIVHRNE